MAKKKKDEWQYPTINECELSNIKMVVKNEEKITKVVHQGKLKQWVGIGWIVIEENPSYFQLMQHPTVVNAKGKPV